MRSKGCTGDAAASAASSARATRMVGDAKAVPRPPSKAQSPNDRRNQGTTRASSCTSTVSNPWMSRRRVIRGVKVCLMSTPSVSAGGSSAYGGPEKGRRYGRSLGLAPVLPFEKVLEFPLEIRGPALLFCGRERVHRGPVVVLEIRDKRSGGAPSREGEGVSRERDPLARNPLSRESLDDAALDPPGHRADEALRRCRRRTLPATQVQDLEPIALAE